ncbi:hypothetical protein ABKV19_004519 [Rosa sericea]
MLDSSMATHLSSSMDFRVLYIMSLLWNNQSVCIYEVPWFIGLLSSLEPLNHHLLKSSRYSSELIILYADLLF